MFGKEKNIINEDDIDRIIENSEFCISDNIFSRGVLLCLKTANGAILTTSFFFTDDNNFARDKAIAVCWDRMRYKIEETERLILNY